MLVLDNAAGADGAASAAPSQVTAQLKAEERQRAEVRRSLKSEGRFNGWTSGDSENQSFRQRQM